MFAFLMKPAICELPPAYFAGHIDKGADRVSSRVLVTPEAVNPVHYLPTIYHMAGICPAGCPAADHTKGLLDVAFLT